MPKYLIKLELLYWKFLKRYIFITVSYMENSRYVTFDIRRYVLKFSGIKFRIKWPIWSSRNKNLLCGDRTKLAFSKKGTLVLITERITDLAFTRTYSSNCLFAICQKNEILICKYALQLGKWLSRIAKCAHAK